MQKRILKLIQNILCANGWHFPEIYCHMNRRGLICRYCGTGIEASAPLVGPDGPIKPNPSHHDGAASAPSVDGVVGSPNKEITNEH